MVRRLWTAAAVVTAVLVGVACSLTSDPTDVELLPVDPDVLRVASFDFLESEVLGELLAQALEGAGLQVERHLGLGSREMLQPALQQGHVDVLPEYLAALLEFEKEGEVLPLDDADEVERLLAEDLADDGVTVLPHAPAVDRDGIAMRAAVASELGIETVDDLAAHASELDFVGPPECPERPACLPRLEARGVRFAHFTGLPAGLAIALALRAGEADVGLMFTSDPLVEQHGLILLEDEHEPQRAENIVPLVRDEVMARHGDRIRAAFAQVMPKLTTQALRGLNRSASDGEPIPEVVREFLSR